MIFSPQITRDNRRRELIWRNGLIIVETLGQYVT